MQTKLTLRLEDALIQQAKNYAKQHGKSLSQVVTDYFKILINKAEGAETPPVTQSLIGIMESSDVDIDDYKRHLEEKYL
ncbi:MAG: antitoxin [gamma proteobacterium endosymbiont of Lamellibrachia anaximandri]|nr:antitoxin [gamma proteobacterium endosymbiont of Lamellibrachia anaximandri]